MSTTFSAGVILGVKLIDIGLKAEFITAPYMVHDKKGKPTGKMEKDYSWKFNYKGVETIEEGKQIYEETIEDIIGIKPPLDFFNINDYYSDYDVDKVVIGINIIDRDYDDYHYLEELSLDKFELVKNELKSQFGVDIEPKLYFFATVS